MPEFLTTFIPKALMTLLVSVVIGLSAERAAAQGKPRDKVVHVTLISEMQEVAPGQTIRIGMHQDIYPGWHTYWLNAGDAGAAPTLTWDLPDGYVVSDLKFPAPSRIPYGELLNYGYSDEVVLPMTLTVPQTARPGDIIALTADAWWLVCEDICIPEEGKVSLNVTVGSANVRDATWGPVLDKAWAGLPVAAPFAVDFSQTTETTELLVRSPDLALALASGSVTQAAFFPRQEGLIEYNAEQIFVGTDEGLRLSLPRGYAEDDFETITGLLVFTQDLGDGTITNAFRFEGNRTAVLAPVPVGRQGGGIGLVRAVVLAFLGGLLLNIMPCVFPVLFLKAFAFLHHADKNPSALRLEGLSYMAGVVGSFALLGGVLIGLRAGGEVIGWGFQLQTPAIVGGLAFLLFAVGLSLSGVFSIGGSIVGVGSSLTETKGQWGSFFTGVLATIVATPCTAPFMGAAMGFALTQSAVAALLVFIFLGVGMATPFVVLTFFPALAARLPKPGLWMERAKQVLAFPMYGAAAWLAWVFALQTDANALLMLLIGAVVLGFGLWIFGVTRNAKDGWPFIGKGIALLSLILVVFSLTQARLGTGDVQAKASGGVISSGLVWEAFSEERVATIVGEGKPVFVNFTAAWCISCLANEKVVFSSDKVREIFDDRGITYLKADWTTRDPAITKALAKFDRAGVPLYLYYSGEPGAAPVILPQILTVGLMLETLAD